MQTFVAEIPGNDPDAMEQFQKLMDEVHKETVEYAFKLAKELGVSEGVAMDITYLRGRSRWTIELENKIIAAAKAGKPCPCVTSGEEREWLEEHGF